MSSRHAADRGQPADDGEDGFVAVPPFYQADTVATLRLAVAVERLIALVEARTGAAAEPKDEDDELTDAERARLRRAARRVGRRAGDGA